MNKNEIAKMNADEMMEYAASEMKKAGKSSEEIAMAEICIQYIMNKKFRKALQDYVFLATYKKGGI